MTQLVGHTWTVVLLLRLFVLPVELQFFTNWSWILQAVVFALARVPVGVVPGGGSGVRARRTAALLLPSAYSLAWTVFIGVTAIAYLNPRRLLVPSDGEGIVVDHVMHCLTLALLLSFAPEIAKPLLRSRGYGYGSAAHKRADVELAPGTGTAGTPGTARPSARPSVAERTCSSTAAAGAAASSSAAAAPACLIGVSKPSVTKGGSE